ncbi:hypothetical protein Pst134EA_030319 [Puccinia striiformis f. sp. tritici]|uniref:hypothetical protein n=1 Tax=Puccinia striiformis f. sp. tritici TaxID=168172 RepID=UPI00200794B5|nr:hypothetical protein Pst134EA_030319 [Puccinia striiformis f. sp. tritici]KAH9440239.1 hypothetical protein Pst134EB_030864 [Puccinia striiformis f. sp. tritici]KAH9446399.1 hypothetical protein Pst134EA_030319 [Puccinia striiformis f. sp. tritici]
MKISRKRHQQFLPFEVIKRSQLNHITPKRLKKVPPSLWATLDDHASEIIKISDQLMESQGIDEALVPKKLLSINIQPKFIPSCTVIGLILSQEVLNALGGKQAPLSNF